MTDTVVLHFGAFEKLARFLSNDMLRDIDIQLIWNGLMERERRRVIQEQLTRIAIGGKA